MNSVNGWTYKAIISILIVSHHHLEELHLIDYLMCTGNFCRRVILTATVRGRFGGGKGESAPLQKIYTYMLLLLCIKSMKISFNDVSFINVKNYVYGYIIYRCW